MSTSNLIDLRNPGDVDAILNHIKSRYEDDEYITPLGSTALIAVNPVISSESEHSLSHIMEFSSSVFKHMMLDQQDQSIVLM